MNKTYNNIGCIHYVAFWIETPCSLIIGANVSEEHNPLSSGNMCLC